MDSTPWAFPPGLAYVATWATGVAGVGLLGRSTLLACPTRLGYLGHVGRCRERAWWAAGLRWAAGQAHCWAVRASAASGPPFVPRWAAHPPPSLVPPPLGRSR